MLGKLLWEVILLDVYIIIIVHCMLILSIGYFICVYFSAKHSVLYSCDDLVVMYESFTEAL